MGDKSLNLNKTPGKQRPFSSTSQRTEVILPFSHAFRTNSSRLTAYRNNMSPYTETIDLCFELFFAKEIRRVFERLREIETDDQHC
jgi:hypothetical protein